eukprot:5429659-Amphidinium_carterae.1
MARAITCNANAQAWNGASASPPTSRLPPMITSQTCVIEAHGALTTSISNCCQLAKLSPLVASSSHHFQEVALQIDEELCPTRSHCLLLNPGVNRIDALRGKGATCVSRLSTNRPSLTPVGRTSATTSATLCNRMPKVIQKWVGTDAAHIPTWQQGARVQDKF